jgi:hypothetical protein
MDKADFLEMIRDWQADHAPEHDDLKIDEPKYEDGKWTAIASDNKCRYILSDDNGNIAINYLDTI